MAQHKYDVPDSVLECPQFFCMNFKSVGSLGVTEISVGVLWNTEIRGRFGDCIARESRTRWKTGRIPDVFRAFLALVCFTKIIEGFT